MGGGIEAGGRGELAVSRRGIYACECGAHFWDSLPSGALGHDSPSLPVVASFTLRKLFVALLLIPSVSQALSLAPDNSEALNKSFMGLSTVELMGELKGRVWKVYYDKGVISGLGFILPYPDGCYRVVSTNRQGVVTTVDPKMCP